MISKSQDNLHILNTLAALQSIWEQYPDMRLGQIIVGLGPGEPALFYIEDDKLIEYMNTILTDLKKGQTILRKE